MLAASILYQALLAAVALAAVPARRTQRTHQRTNVFQLASSDVADSSLSPNWAGAVLVEPTATYTSATGTFVVPAVSLPANSTSGTTYTGSIWVGIDGWQTCGTSILQAGIEIWIDDSGTTTYEGWAEWWPNDPVGLSDISFSEGDSVTVTVTASSTTAGTAVVENTTKGQTATYSYSDQTAHPLCEFNAEWIVEAYDEGGDLLPFFAFDAVTFTGASATTADGTQVDTTGATLTDIQRTEVLTSTSASGSTVTIDYIA
ncbi:unnamed protein product [Peniophora sp. CBMAI 1063]|nr:unnamed protein product [Peniophora sp. CBMAI 1063]